MTTSDSQTEEAPRFLTVGHCGPDGWMLRTAIQRSWPDATVESIGDEADLEALLANSTGPAVLLVNRKLDGRFEASDGIDLIRNRQQPGSDRVWMLISNFDDAQSEAVAAGAHPGFGKTALNRPETTAVLESAVARSRGN